MPQLQQIKTEVEDALRFRGAINDEDRRAIELFDMLDSAIAHTLGPGEDRCLSRFRPPTSGRTDRPMGEHVAFDGNINRYLSGFEIRLMGLMVRVTLGLSSMPEPPEGARHWYLVIEGESAGYKRIHLGPDPKETTLLGPSENITEHMRSELVKQAKIKR